jgi:hypothetical protein
MIHLSESCFSFQLIVPERLMAVIQFSEQTVTHKVYNLLLKFSSIQTCALKALKLFMWTVLCTCE